MLAAVNLGDDADTTAAIFGQIAGAYYGAEGIPARWRERVFMADKIMAMADDLCDLAFGESVAGKSEGRSSRPERVNGIASTKGSGLPGDSYWVDEGRLLAGPYPGAPSEAEAQGKLDAFLGPIPVGRQRWSRRVLS